MKKILYEQMVPQELIDEKKRKSIVYLPIGPLEWHGPHMGMGVDAANAYNVSKLVAAKAGGVVLPTLYMGTESLRSPECLRRIGFRGTEKIVGMDFPKNSLKSLYWPEALFERVVTVYLKMLVAANYRLIVLVNGHGADNQIKVLKRIAKKFTKKTLSVVLYEFALSEECCVKIGHAGLAETSIMSYLCPDSVELERLPAKPQKLKNTDYAIVDNDTFLVGSNKDCTVRYDPREATADLGKKIIGQTAELIAKHVTREWNQISSEIIQFTKTDSVKGSSQFQGSGK